MYGTVIGHVQQIKYYGKENTSMKKQNLIPWLINRDIFPEALMLFFVAILSVLLIVITGVLR
jgi:hypothetical protein